MLRTRVRYRCQDCGSASPKWVGRCPDCGVWASLVEEPDAPLSRAAGVPSLAGREPAIPILEVDSTEHEPSPTTVAELDRVLGGGLVPGSVTLLGGEPGIGKSTLVLQALAGFARRGRRALLVSGEESRQQVRARAERVGALQGDLWLLAETSLPAVLARVEEVRPTVLAIDSIQTVHDPALESAPGSVAQVREGAHRLVQLAKQTGMATILVGHVTKDGGLAGPRVLEHLVDSVLSFEGERHHALRMVRAIKHRFGSTSELGVFEMTGEGLRDVADPSALFLADRRAGTPGSVVAPILEGSRPLLVEVQALVAEAGTPIPRRAGIGIDGGRLAMLLGVLEKRARVRTATSDVYASVAGGVRLGEPGADLAVCLALASAASDRPVPPDVVAGGEVGLGGAVRHPAHHVRRLAEAARVGFRRAVVPLTAPDAPGLEVLRVGDLDRALRALRLESVPL
jgi:DNA repair protein RadA/Sms